VGFAFIVGIGNIPALRAVIVGCLFLLQQNTGRPGTSSLLLVYGIGLLTLQNPLVWSSISFMLSVGAVCGIFVVGKQLAEIVGKKVGVVLEIVLITISVMLVTLPISGFAFGEVQIWGLLTNLVVVPLISLVMISGGVGVICSLLIPDVAKYFFWLSSIPLGFSINVARFASENNPNIKIEPLQVACICFVVVILIDYLHFRMNLK